MESGPVAAHAGKMRTWRTAAAAVAAPSPDAERWLLAAFAQTSALRREAAALPRGPGVEALHAVLKTLVLYSRAPDAERGRDAEHARDMAVWMPGMPRRVKAYNAAVFALRGFDVSLARRYVEEPPALDAPVVAALDAARCCLRSARALRLDRERSDVARVAPTGQEPLRLGGEPPAVAALDAVLCCLRSAQASTHEPMRYADEPLRPGGEPPTVVALDAALCCLRSARTNTHKIITLLVQ